MKKILAILLVFFAFHVAMPNLSSAIFIFFIDCKECGGSGQCTNCDGTGNLGGYMVLDNGRDSEPPPDCDVCDGTGKCQKCNGSGKVPVNTIK